MYGQKQLPSPINCNKELVKLSRLKMLRNFNISLLQRAVNTFLDWSSHLEPFPYHAGVSPKRLHLQLISHKKVKTVLRWRTLLYTSVVSISVWLTASLFPRLITVLYTRHLPHTSISRLTYVMLLVAPLKILTRLVQFYLKRIYYDWLHKFVSRDNMHLFRDKGLMHNPRKCNNWIRLKLVSTW